LKIDDSSIDGSAAIPSWWGHVITDLENAVPYYNLCDCRFYSIANSFHIWRLELARINYGRWDVAHVRDPFL
jgi:hypothetical protein